MIRSLHLAESGEEEPGMEGRAFALGKGRLEHPREQGRVTMFNPLPSTCPILTGTAVAVPAACSRTSSALGQMHPIE